MAMQPQGVAPGHHEADVSAGRHRAAPKTGATAVHAAPHRHEADVSAGRRRGAPHLLHIIEAGPAAAPDTATPTAAPSTATPKTPPLAGPNYVPPPAYSSPNGGTHSTLQSTWHRQRRRQAQ